MKIIMFKMIISVLAILGAAIVYWVLMSNFLFSTVAFVHGESDIMIAIVTTMCFQTA